MFNEFPVCRRHLPEDDNELRESVVVLLGRWPVLVADELLVVVVVEVVRVACDADAVIVLPGLVVPEVTNDAMGGPGKV